MWRIVVPAAGLVVIATGFTTLWPVFAFAVGILLTVGLGLLYFRLRALGGLTAVVLIAVLSGSFGVCLFQVGEPVHLDSVVVPPPVSDDTATTAYPYFGEDDGYVFLAEVFHAANGDELFSRRILTCQRASLSLTFVPASQFLFLRVQRTPWEVLLNIDTPSYPSSAPAAVGQKTRFARYASC